MKHFNAILSLFLCIIMIITSLPLGIVSADRVSSGTDTQIMATAGSIDNDLLVSSKSISANSDGSFTLKMEGYAKAPTIPTYTSKIKPVDVFFLIDHSGSAVKCINCYSSISKNTEVFYGTRNGATTSFDKNLIYYADASESSPIRFCSDCNDWYGGLHYYGYHGGTRYIPRRVGNTHYLTAFYATDADRKAGTNPIYAGSLNKSSTYYNGQDSETLKYCSFCDAWVRSDKISNHDAASDSHDNYIYICKTSASDIREIVKFCTGSSNCSVSGIQCVPQYAAQQNAIKEYLDLLYSSAVGPDGASGTGDDLDHRVAIVDYYQDTGSRYLTVKNSSGAYVKYNDINGTGTEATDRVTYSRQALKSVRNENDRKIIGEGLSYVNYGSGDVPLDFALRMAEYAYTNDSNKSACDNGSRNRIVILMGDNSDGNNKKNGVVASGTLKQNFPNTYIYTMAMMNVLDTNPSGNVSISSANQLYHALSSNYPYATNYSQANHGTLNSNRPSCGSYYHSANGMTTFTNSMKQIFNESVNGLTSFTMTGSTAYMQDVVSSAFTIKSAKAYSLKYGGNTSTWTTGSNYTATVSGNTVKVTGFDYTANWVGYTVKKNYQGQKLVLEIVITPKTPGNGISTNDTSKSGIYHNSNGMQEMFDLPKADVPATVTFATSCGSKNVSMTASAVK
ncbi:MAG: hypothetical protein IKU19_07595, partial [Clostridia bacterium]|nr:hypothetical protein [Clostridia bacterium]